MLVLHSERTVLETCALEHAPDWAKPILESALQLAE